MEINGFPCNNEEEEKAYEYKRSNFNPPKQSEI
mgnify:CR=1 FL=1